MEYKYKGENKIRKAINEWGEIALVAYAILGSCSNYIGTTGHLSSDIATGLKQPTALEQSIIDFVKK